jgi:hypothetical protein
MLADEWVSKISFVIPPSAGEDYSPPPTRLQAFSLRSKVIGNENSTLDGINSPNFRSARTKISL